MGGGRDDDSGDDGPLGAMWGGGSDGDEGSGGPPPRAEEVRARERGDDPPDEVPGEEFAPGRERSLLERVTAVLQAHKTLFTIALFAYAFLGMPWLLQNGYRPIGLLGGALFLGGIVLVTIANANEALETLRGGGGTDDDERRGF